MKENANQNAKAMLNQTDIQHMILILSEIISHLKGETVEKYIRL